MSGFPISSKANLCKKRTCSILEHMSNKKEKNNTHFLRVDSVLIEGEIEKEKQVSAKFAHTIRHGATCKEFLQVQTKQQSKNT